MTITEAKKIIEMCADAVKKGDGEDAKIYVNKEYVLSILDMVETAPITWPEPDYPYPWHPTNPNWPPTWPQVWYKDSTDEPENPGPGFEKVPWWVWYKSPWGEFTCDVNSTGSKPQDADIKVTSAGTTSDPLKNTAQPGMFANITDDCKQAPLTDELKRFREYQNTNSKPIDNTAKRTDYIDDWAGGSTTGGGSYSETIQ